MYADTITESMQKTIDETNYRRGKQMKWNLDNNIVPKALKKSLDSPLSKNPAFSQTAKEELSLAAEPDTEYLTKPQLDKLIREKRKAMEKAAKELDFMQAAKLRDEIKVLQERS